MMESKSLGAADGHHVDVMEHDLEYLVALAEARSCLVALSDSAPVMDDGLGVGDLTGRPRSRRRAA